MGSRNRPGQPFAAIAAEEARLRAAYDRRKSNGRYSWFNRAHLFMLQEQERYMLALLQRFGYTSLNEKRILEIGCGTGHWMRECIKWGARPEHVVGVDLLADRVEEARRLCPAGVQLRCSNVVRLEFPDAAFDLVIQSTVFTSILNPDIRCIVAAEMQRVVKPGGLIVWYDYRVKDPRNLDVRRVGKREIYQLFPDCRIRLRSITLVPPLTRFLAPASWLLCYLLGKIPFLCTHYLGAIQKGGDL